MVSWCNVGFAKILPEGTPKEQYDFALHFVKIAEYETAELALKEFVDINPNHELAGSAQYWYAETFRIRQYYLEATSAYLDGYEKYPNSVKGPVNLLKLGLMLVYIGEWDQGCSIMGGVNEMYPNASQSVLQRAEFDFKRMCKNPKQASKWVKKAKQYPGHLKTKTAEEFKQIEMTSMIDDAKDKCKVIGYEEGTEKFADCTLKLYSQSVELAAKNNQQIVIQGQSSGSNVMTIYDPVRDSNAAIKRGQGLINGTCTLGDLSNC